MIGVSAESGVTLFVLLATVLMAVLWIKNMDVHSFVLLNGEIYTVEDEVVYAAYRRRMTFTHYYRVTHHRKGAGESVFITHFKVPDSFECCNEALKHRLFKRAARRAGINMTEITYYKRII